MTKLSAKAIKQFVWIDLEMTGLDHTNDSILEIATIITQPTLEVIAYGPTLYITQPIDYMTKMNPEVYAMHKRSGLLEKVCSSSITLADAYAQTLQFIRMHCAKEEAVLCGNSIWQDRLFLKQYMPNILEHLNYRMVDVSTLKVLINNWYPVGHNTEFQKSNAHRALEDIQESIDELKHYRAHFFIKN